MTHHGEFDPRAHWPEFDRIAALHAAHGALRQHRLGQDALSHVVSQISTFDWVRLTEQERRGMSPVLALWVEVGMRLLDGHDASAPAIELVETMLSLEQAGAAPAGCGYAFAFAYSVTVDDLADHL